MPPLVSVVLPTFCERESIGQLIDEIHLQLETTPHEIIVVDDNSPDQTFAHLTKLSEARPYLKCQLRNSNPSLAGSLADGIKIAAGEYLILMDSDFNHQPRYLPFIVQNLTFYDVVIGSRFLYGGSMNQRARHLLSWIFNAFVRVATGGYVTDNLYGFVGIRRAILSRIPSEKIFWGYGDYCIRLLYYLQKQNRPILQFPAQNGTRLAGEGNRRFFKTFCQYTFEVCRLVWREKIRCTPKSETAEFAAINNS